ncbi:MAG: DGQHR domain-containing protein, partial [Chloroflexota bacterium]|nr:DGQHR domain-containing protein [Chloroflexota bacterium]
MSLIVPAPREQLFEVQAQRYEQGGREVFTFPLDLAQLDGVFPPRVDEDVVKDANRRLTPSHAKQIEWYLDQQPDWVLGGILLGVEREAVRFVRFEDEAGTPSEKLGTLQIPLNRLSAIKMFDGQHRRRAIHDLLARLRNYEREYEQQLNEAIKNKGDKELIASLRNKLSQTQTKLQSMEKQSIPVVLYMEGDINALKRMFADAARTKPIEAVTRARFDDRDPFNLAADKVAEQSELLQDIVEWERSTVARTSPKLLAFNQLATILKTLVFGYYGRVSRERNREFQANYQPVVELGLEWTDNFLPSVCREYEQLLDQEVDSASLIPVRRPETFAYNVTVLRVLAACFHDWRQEVGEDVQPLVEYIRNESFDTSVERSLLIKAGLVVAGTNGTNSPVARQQDVKGAIRYILDKAEEPVSA